VALIGNFWPLFGRVLITDLQGQKRFRAQVRYGSERSPAARTTGLPPVARDDRPDRYPDEPGIKGNSATPVESYDVWAAGRPETHPTLVAKPGGTIPLLFSMTMIPQPDILPGRDCQRHRQAQPPPCPLPLTRHSPLARSTWTLTSPASPLLTGPFPVLDSIRVALT